MNNKSVNERLAQLRRLMCKNEIDVYIVPTSDFHMSEYVNEYFKCRQFLSGFTGSAGTLVITAKDAYLFTDGRYFIQAEEELKNSDIRLMRMGDKGVPGLEEFVEEVLPHKGTIGFDGRVVSRRFGVKMEQIAVYKDGAVICDIDMAGEIWEDRPKLDFKEIYVLEDKYTGKSLCDKLELVREEMKKHNAKAYVLSSLDDQAWLFNLRGKDIPCNPVFLAYSIITMDKVTLYTGAKIPESVCDKGVCSRSYSHFYTDLQELEGNVLVDESVSNYAIVKSLINAEVIDVINPTTLMKAVKNETEIANLKKCHIKDGIAVTKFMYWLKTNIGKIEITEISAADYLEKLRREVAGCVDLSFDTISAYGSNAAMMHYSADEKSNAVLKPEGMLLVDSGGQYFEGTTDITRTFVLGPVSDEIKKHFTLVAKSVLRLANAKFLYGCTGLNLDILARGPLWDIGLDYKCGTGHGVGYMLNVHEGPNGFRWKKVPERNDGCVLEAGMVTTDEPGVYIEGSHGIRTENELVCVELEENEYGQFMGFETITYAPVDLDGIDVKWLDESDKIKLNDYHSMVYEKISPYLDEDEKEWLKEYTRKI